MCLSSNASTDLCLNGGYCSSSTGSCVCSTACFVGNYCEINYNAARLPLVGAIVQDSQQSRETYIITFVLFTALGLTNNIVGLLVFLRERIRYTNCGVYLITFSIVNMFLMTSLLTYLITIVRYSNPTYQSLACHFIPFITIITLDGSILLTVAVAVERVLMECFNFPLYGSRMRAFIVSIIIIVYACGSNIDEIFLRRISNDLLGNPVCAYDFEQYPTWRRSDIVFSYAHVIIPCVMHLVCTICVLTTIARRKILINSTSRGLVFVWLHQLYLHRDFLIPPLCLIVCILPHGILGHLLKTCIPYSDTVKLRLHISFILMLYVPQVISFVLYIYPNLIYLKEFQQMAIYRTLCYYCYRKRRLLRRQECHQLVWTPARSCTTARASVDTQSTNSGLADDHV